MKFISSSFFVLKDIPNHFFHVYLFIFSQSYVTNTLDKKSQPRNHSIFAPLEALMAVEGVVTAVAFCECETDDCSYR